MCGWVERKALKKKQFKFLNFLSRRRCTPVHTIACKALKRHEWTNQRPKRVYVRSNLDCVNVTIYCQCSPITKLIMYLLVLICFKEGIWQEFCGSWYAEGKNVILPVKTFSSLLASPAHITSWSCLHSI